MFYEVDVNNVLNLLRFPRYLEIVNRVYGKVSQNIVE